MISTLQANYQLLQQQQSAANQTVGTLVDQVNTLTAQIAQLNQQIVGSDTQGVNNNAVDQRTALTNQLAQLVGINVIDGGNGQYQITLDSGAATLVSGNSSFELKTVSGGPDNFSQVKSVMNGTTVDVTSSIKNGQLGAQLQLRDTTYAGYESQLDTLAAGIASQVNLQSEQGFDGNGSAVTGTNWADFFQGTQANGPNGLPTTLTPTAANPYKGMVNALSVNALIAANPTLIAAGGVANAVGDNTNANAIANLQFTGGSNASGVVLGSSYSAAVSDLVSKVGSDSQRYQSQSTTQQNIVSALQAQRNQLSGVSLDEEATKMMQLQSGYQAAARFLSVINQLTAGLITQFGGTA
jgi:flagellar hook-associated protein 1 FlgK